MSVRKSIKEQELEALESEFRPLLISCLDECAAKRWGLFVLADHPDLPSRYLWKEARQLKDLALEIRARREEFGKPNRLAERFLHECSLRGANLSGEPKRAKSLLDEIRLGNFD